MSSGSTRRILFEGLRTALLLLLIPVAFIVIAEKKGAHLHKEHTAVASGIVEASPARVWELLTDVAAQPTWRGTPVLINRVPFNPAARDCWYEPWPLIRLPLCATDFGQTYRVLHTARSAMPFSATWTFELAAVPGSDTQTTVTITQSSVIEPPLWRFIGRYILLRHTFAADYLSHLQAEALHHP